jgi:hypothetical protein
MASLQADYGWYRAQYSDKTTIKQILASDSGTFDAVIAPKSVNHSVFVQRIIFNVTTDAAQTLTFQDGAGSPVVIAKSPASPGLGIEIVADFGPQGIQLTRGEELDIVISAAGLAGQINLEAYERLTPTSALPVAYDSGAALQ